MLLTLSHAQLAPGLPLRTAYGVNAPTLVAPAAASGHYRLLAGPLPQEEPFKARLITDGEAISALDLFTQTAEPLPRLGQIALACALSAHLRTPQISALLHVRNSPEVWRWAALAKAAPTLRDAVLSGKLSAGHLRPLLTLRVAEQTEWTARALRGRWSVRQLTAALRRESGRLDGPSNADLRALEAALGERLGTTVRVDWPDDPAGQRRLLIHWYDVESLKGILDQLARGPEYDDTAPLPAQARQLVIPVQNAGELAALTQHLSDL